MPSRFISSLVVTAAAVAFATTACSQTGPDQAVKSGDTVVFGDWRLDAPGVHHQIALSDLPGPTAPSVGPSQVVAPTPGALPKVPAGFSVSLFASGLEAPRASHLAPNGDVFVAEQTAGRVRVLRAPGGARPTENSVFVTGLDQPFGVAFYPAGPNPQWIYVAENNRVVRYPYHSGDLKAAGPAEVIVAKLANSTGGHWTRDLAFSPDGKRLYISVGSEGNIDEGMSKKNPADAAAWQAGHALGAAWDNNEHRANVLAVDPDGKNLQVYAAGIRNCSGLTVQPGTGAVWCSTNERDLLGDNLVPDYATHVQEGAFYGWPWYYIGDHEDPRLKGERPDLKGKVTVPDLLIQAHSAAVQIRFYDVTSGPNLFPAEYQGGAFIALHGSWNRAHRTGYKVVFAPMKNGMPAGGYTDFMTGFVVNDSDVWGRPYGLVAMPDGALLVTDDANGQIFRVTPTK